MRDSDLTNDASSAPARPGRADLLVVAATERELFPVAGPDLLCCGIGPIEAALLTARRLHQSPYRALLHVGIAGASALSPGTVVIGSEAVYCDIIDANSTLPRVDRIAGTPALIEAARRVLPEAHVAPIATAARVGGGRRYEVEAMEGFGVLRAAGLVGVPAVEVRVISNLVHEVDRSRWRIAEALEVLRDAVARLVPALGDRMAPFGD